MSIGDAFGRSYICYDGPDDWIIDCDSGIGCTEKATDIFEESWSGRCATTSNLVRGRPEEMVCNQGTFFNTTSGVCDICPANSYCPYNCSFLVYEEGSPYFSGISFISYDPVAFLPTSTSFCSGDEDCEIDFQHIDFSSNHDCQNMLLNNNGFTVSCPTSHPYSDAGTTDIANCYTGCGTGYSGRNYYNATDTCSCDTLCTSVANRETRSGSESCTRSCSIANGTCSYSGSTQTYTDTCASNYTDAGCSSAGESCSGCSSWTRTSTGACSGGTISITCNAGYYLSNGTCVKCSAGTYSAAGATSCTSCGTGKYSAAGASSCSTCPSGYRNGAAAASQSACVGAFTKTGSQTACSQPANSTSYACGTCSPGTCTYYKNYAGTITQDCTPTNCTKPVASVSCKANYYASGVTCPACPTSYPYSDAGTTSDSYCYASKTSTGSQLACSTPSGCASSTCGTCTPGTCSWRDYKSATDTSCTPTNCTKPVASVTANANRYVSGTTCPACSSYSSTYTQSDGGSIGSGSCYIVHTNTGTEVAPSLPTGCAAQTVNSCTKPTCSYKDYAGQSGETCSPGTCNQTHKACTSASANYYLASGVAKTCSSYSSSYPSSAGGNITSSSCYGSFSKSGSQLACSQPANSASYTCGSCTVGTCNYTKYASGTIKTDCTPTNCTKPVASVSCKANYYASGVTCPACPTSYPYSDAGTTSDSYCYASKTSTGSQLACSTPSGCASSTCGTCTPGTCNWRDYKSATDTSCTPTNCTKPVASVTASANRYVSGTTCPACDSNYPYSDGGSISDAYCYASKTSTGSQLACSTPSGCASSTCGTCTPGTCSWRDYKSATDTSCTPTNCTKPVASVTANANRYVSGTTCPACDSNYPYSDGGNIGEGNCYVTKTSTGSQLACSTPSGCASSTCGTCTPGTCNWRDYKSATDTSCTPTNCTKPVASVTANANRYVSGTTCPACPTAYPSSDGGNIGEGNCYVTKTNTGSQLSCSQPENSESYTCGTCTPGTCNWRDYKSATDTPCTPDNCTQPVNPGSVVCNTGYYTSGTTCPACTNAPSNSSYTGTATSNDCPWKCSDGYNLTPDGYCARYCAAGVTHIHLGTGLKIPLYSAKRTTPSINVRHNGTVCYADLIEGESTGLHVKYNGKTYHAAE